MTLIKPAAAETEIQRVDFGLGVCDNSPQLPRRAVLVVQQFVGVLVVGDYLPLGVPLEHPSTEVRKSRRRDHYSKPNPSGS
jgi:hypothetical protein